MHGTLGLVLCVSSRKERPMTFVTVHCPHCDSEQIVTRGQTRRGTQRYLCQKTACDHRPPVSLASLMLYEAVTSTMALTSGNALRMHWRGTGRPMQGLRNVHHTAIRRMRSPSHACGRVTAGVHGYPRAGAPLRLPTTTRDNPVAAHRRSNDPIASDAS